MSTSRETKGFAARKRARGIIKGLGEAPDYPSFWTDTGTAEKLPWIKDVKVRPSDRERKMYYVELKGDSKFRDDEKGLMLYAIEFLIDTFGSAGVKMFAFADKGRCCFYLAKYELKAVQENYRVDSVEEAPENADLEIF